MPKKSIKGFVYPDWLLSNVAAFSTTRHSPRPLDQQRHDQNKRYGDFNLALHVGDNEKSVNNNRQQLNAYLPENVSIQWLEQVHGSTVVDVTRGLRSNIAADASYTRNKTIALAIMTADCLPIMLTTEHGDEIAAIHGGWRSLSKGIIHNTIALFNAGAIKIHAWLGPCIGNKAFEVGADVYERFVSMNVDFKIAFTPLAKNKYFADLHEIAKIQLKALGISNIYQTRHCTFHQVSDYYSYRREGQTGRMATLIAMKP